MQKYIYIVCIQIVFNTVSASTKIDSASSRVLPQSSPLAIQILQQFDPDIKKSNLFQPHPNTLLSNQTNASSEQFHPLLRDGALDAIYTIAVATKAFIKKSKPHDFYQIFSLGQSLAWIVATMELIDLATKTTDASYGYIAFSGSFFKPDFATNQLVAYDRPPQQYIAAYQEYFKKINSTKAAGAYTCLIESAYHGTGIRSFWEVVQPCLSNNSIDVYVNNRSNMPFGLPSKKLSFINEYTNRALIVPLANADHFDDRLVLQYVWRNWTTKDPFQFKPSQSALLLHKIIKTYVEAKNSQ